MHGFWDINIGQVVTWVIAIAGFCYAVGRIAQRVDGISQTCDERHDDFTRHEEQANARFENLNQRLAYIQSALRKEN